MERKYLLYTVLDERKTIAYARVSSCDLKEDLLRQSQVLELYCAEHGYKYELITDLGSGMNYYKKGLTNLINQILNNDVKRLVITHKDESSCISVGKNRKLCTLTPCVT